MLERLMEGVVLVIEWAGILVILVGLAAASAAFVIRLSKRARFVDAYQDYRRNVGRGILLGLEFLVAADIVNTVVLDLTFRSLGILGLIVLIRTFLSFTLEVEIHGRWPWQERPSG